MERDRESSGRLTRKVYVKYDVPLGSGGLPVECPSGGTGAK